MKFLIATPLYPPDIGGPATDAHALHEALIQKGHDVQVCSFQDVRAYPRLLRHCIYAYRLSRMMRGIEKLVVFDTVSVGVPSALIAGLYRVPYVVRVPGDYAWEQGVQRFGVKEDCDTFQHTHYGLRIETLRMLQRAVVQHASLVIAPSIYFKTIVASWGVAPEKLMSIYLGLDLPYTTHVSALHDPLTMVSFGRFVPWKGFDFLLDLLVALPEWRLVLGGDGPLRASLEARAKELGVYDRVTFLGALSHDDVLAWYQKADAFVYNTTWESFSFQVLEALASGVPVITTRVGSLPELLTDGVEGVLCTPYDTEAFVQALNSIEGDTERWHMRTNAAKEKAKQFSATASSEAFVRALT